MIINLHLCAFRNIQRNRSRLVDVHRHVAIHGGFPKWNI